MGEKEQIICSSNRCSGSDRCYSRARTDNAQSKTVETTLVAIQTGNDPNLPPLMNPAMLEASDDLTNLSHLNEPAGMQ
jgi:myosin heavy subunit